MLICRKKCWQRFSPGAHSKGKITFMKDMKERRIDVFTELRLSSSYLLYKYHKVLKTFSKRKKKLKKS